MQTTRSPRRFTAHGDAQHWARRHRLQHSKPAALDERTSRRFAVEFEKALAQRGAEAKAHTERWAALYAPAAHVMIEVTDAAV